MKKFFFAVLLCSIVGTSMAQSITTSFNTKGSSQNIALPREHFDVNGASVDLYFLAHASLAISVNDGSETHWVYVDPVGMNGSTPIDYANLPEADFVLLTHEHPDHFDLKTIESHSKEGTQVFGPKSCSEKVRDYVIMLPGNTVKLGPIVSVLATEAYNTTKDRQKYHKKGVGVGYLLTIGDSFKIYIAGDTEPIEEMKGLASKNIDVALLPVNQPYTMTPEQCLEAAKMIEPKMLIPYHMGDTDLKSIEKGLAGLKGTELRMHPEMK